MERAIAESILVQHSSLIPVHGFGIFKVTKVVNDGLVTEVVSRSYSLSCGCIVTSHNECGGVCYGCLNEFSSSVHESLPPEITQGQLDWMATPCSRHFVVCSAPFCGRGGCSKHMAQYSTDEFYCSEHFELALSESEKEEQQERHGTIKSGLLRFARSLFLNDE